MAIPWDGQISGFDSSFKGAFVDALLWASLAETVSFHVKHQRWNCWPSTTSTVERKNGGTLAKKKWMQNWCLLWPYEIYGSTSPRSARQHGNFAGIEKSSRASTKRVSTESTDPRATTENSFQEGSVWKILGSTLQVFARLFSMFGRQLTIHVPANLLLQIYLWIISGRKRSKRALVKRTKCGKKCQKNDFPKGFSRSI